MWWNTWDNREYFLYNDTLFKITKVYIIKTSRAYTHCYYSKKYWWNWWHKSSEYWTNACPLFRWIRLSGIPYSDYDFTSFSLLQPEPTLLTLPANIWWRNRRKCPNFRRNWPKNYPTMFESNESFKNWILRPCPWCRKHFQNFWTKSMKVQLFWNSM